MESVQYSQSSFVICSAGTHWQQNAKLITKHSVLSVSVLHI